jgi:hypothetical protein
MGKAGSADFSVFQVDGFDLLPAKVQTATHKVENVLEQTTGLGDRWEEHTPTGLRRVLVTQTGAFFDTRQNTIHEAFQGMPLTPRTLVMAVGPAGGTAVVATGVYNQSYSVEAKNAKLTRANVTYTVSGAVSESAIVQAPDPQTADWTSAVIDQGAATAGGGEALQLVTQLTGPTGFVGTLRDSPDGIVFADLIAFASVVAAGAAKTLPIAGTIDRYVVYSGNLDGDGTVRVLASLKRH